MGLLNQAVMSLANRSGAMMGGGAKGSPLFLFLFVLALMLVNAWIVQYSFNAFRPYLEASLQRELPAMHYWTALWLSILTGALFN